MTRVSSQQLTKRGHLALFTVLSLLASAAMLCSCTGKPGMSTQPRLSGDIGRKPVSSDQNDVNILIDLARSDMATRLGVRPGEVVVQGTEPLTFPPSPAGAERARRPGYVIRLAVGGQEWQYAGRLLGDAYVLWREVE
jgi:hypothetical protein